MKVVPSTRLLFWVALILVPATTLAVALPPTAPIAAGVAALLCVVAVVDAIMGSGCLDRLGVETPELVRLLKGRAGSFPIVVANPEERARTLKLAFEFPADLQPKEEVLSFRIPGEAAASRLDALVTPRRRGNYRLERAFLESASPMGLWDVRRQVPLATELRVYPDLSGERRSLAALFLNRGSLGVHAQRQVGKGRDFEKLRDYMPGDSIEDIHWKASAKRGHPVTKVYQIERTQEVYVILDASRLSGRLAEVPLSDAPAGPESAGDEEGGVAVAAPTALVSVLERFVTSALVVGAAAERQGDLFGLLTFSDQVHTFFRARNGQAHYTTCRDALYTLEPRLVAPDYDELFTFIRTRLRRRALLVFLTALDDAVLAESFLRNVDLIRRQHLVLVNMLRPEGAEPLFSDANVSTLDDVYRRLGGHINWQALREIEGQLRSRGVHFSLLENERLSLQLVTQYLSIKQRQLL